MQRKLLGVCYWTSVILGTKTNRFRSSNRSTREKYLFAVPPGAGVRVGAPAGCTDTAPRRAISATPLITVPKSHPQSPALKVYFQVICTYPPVIPKLTG